PGRGVRASRRPESPGGGRRWIRAAARHDGAEAGRRGRLPPPPPEVRQELAIGPARPTHVIADGEAEDGREHDHRDDARSSGEEEEVHVHLPCVGDGEDEQQYYGV